MTASLILHCESATRAVTIPMSTQNGLKLTT
jgi:hypothetical protein